MPGNYSESAHKLAEDYSQTFGLAHRRLALYRKFRSCKILWCVQLAFIVTCGESSGGDI